MGSADMSLELLYCMCSVALQASSLRPMSWRGLFRSRALLQHVVVLMGSVKCSAW